MPRKSNEMSGETNSMSKATICCLSRRRWKMRKRWASVGEDCLVMDVEAVKRDRVVWWTIWWARSSKMEDWVSLVYDGG